MYDAKPIAPKLMYGAYNEANAKLVTAEGDYPSNYEHYSNFEPRSQKKRTGILKGSPLKGNFSKILLDIEECPVYFPKRGYSRNRPGDSKAHSVRVSNLRKTENLPRS